MCHVTHGPTTPSSLQEEGTLIGTALAVCLGYWLIMSTLVFFGAYLLNMALSFLQVLSLMVSACYGPSVITLPTACGSVLSTFAGLCPCWPLLSAALDNHS